jgi:hypothetical protein
LKDSSASHAPLIQARECMEQPLRSPLRAVDEPVVVREGFGACLGGMLGARQSLVLTKHRLPITFRTYPPCGFGFRVRDRPRAVSAFFGGRTKRVNSIQASDADFLR